MIRVCKMDVGRVDVGCTEGIEEVVWKVVVDLCSSL